MTSNLFLIVQRSLAKNFWFNCYTLGFIIETLSWCRHSGHLLSVSLKHSPSLPLSLTHSHSLSLTHTHTLTYKHTHTQTLFISQIFIYLCLPLSSVSGFSLHLSHMHTRSFHPSTSYSLALSSGKRHLNTHINLLFLLLSKQPNFAHTHTHSLSLLHTHPNILSLTLSLFIPLRYTLCFQPILVLKFFFTFFARSHVVKSTNSPQKSGFSQMLWAKIWPRKSL